MIIGYFYRDTATGFSQVKEGHAAFDVHNKTRLHSDGLSRPVAIFHQLGCGSQIDIDHGRGIKGQANLIAEATAQANLKGSGKTLIVNTDAQFDLETTQANHVHGGSTTQGDFERVGTEFEEERAIDVEYVTNLQLTFDLQAQVVVQGRIIRSDSDIAKDKITRAISGEYVGIRCILIHVTVFVTRHEGIVQVHCPADGLELEYHEAAQADTRYGTAGGQGQCGPSENGRGAGIEIIGVKTQVQRTGQGTDVIYIQAYRTGDLNVVSRGREADKTGHGNRVEQGDTALNTGIYIRSDICGVRMGAVRVWRITINCDTGWCTL